MIQAVWLSPTHLGRALGLPAFSGWPLYPLETDRAAGREGYARAAGDVGAQVAEVAASVDGGAVVDFPPAAWGQVDAVAAAILR